MTCHRWCLWLEQREKWISGMDRPQVPPSSWELLIMLPPIKFQNQYLPNLPSPLNPSSRDSRKAQDECPTAAPLTLALSIFCQEKLTPSLLMPNTAHRFQIYYALKILMLIVSCPIIIIL